MIEISINKPTFQATAEYEDGRVIVKAGSTINPLFATYIKGISFARECRDNPEIVDPSFVVKRDCEFPSPSTAAQFVMGQSRDGFDAWKTSSGESLGKYLESKGLRERKRRKKEE